jgi:hypothetical protein
VPPSDLGEQVAEAANLVGLLLALVTLFTSEQARRLADERGREGGARPARLISVRYVCVGLGATTVAALAFLGPLMIDVVDAVGGDDWEPLFGVFALTYVLLGALLAWQIVLATRTR